MPVFNKMVYNGTEYILGGGGNIGEPLNLTVTSTGLDATITREDNEIGTIPPTSFVKSELVRKIGSAPTSPSDGTLLVTETVKDTYKVSGYVDQGLTDGTTYYYRVFSYSDLGGISYCDAVSYTATNPRTPGANTLLYMPMTSITQAIDQSGNNVPTSNNGVTFGTYQGVDCGYFDRNNIQITTPFTIPSNITVLCWCYNTGYYVSNQDGKIFDARGNGGRFLTSYSNNDSSGYVGTWSVGLASSDQHQNEWVLVAFTVDSGGNGTIYTKGANSNTVNTATGTWASYSPTTMNIGNEHDNGVPRNFLGGLSNLIVESKVWTAQEISDYYDQTKANYGISRKYFVTKREV